MSFDPALYALLHTGNPGDAAFYRTLCAGAASALEFGAGDGRILRAIDCVPDRVGVELHSGMAALAMERTPGARIVEGDMATIDLARRFERVIVPYNALYCAADDDGVIAVFRNARRHLADDGLLAFDGYQVSPDVAELTDDDEFNLIETLEHEGCSVGVFEKDRHWPRERRCEVSYLHQIIGPDSMRQHRYSITHHYLDPLRLPELLGEAGLYLQALWGDFDQRPLEEGERMVAIAAVT